MIAPELADELRLIAYAPQAKPINRVNALNLLAKNSLDTVKVRDTLYSLATDNSTPDSVKVRAIDLLDKLDISTAPKDLAADEAANLEQSLLEQYVGTT